MYMQSPSEWLPGDSPRVWKLNAPAYSLNDAPVAFHRSLKRYLVNECDSLKLVDARLEASKFDTCLCFVYRRSGLAAGVITTHIDDLLGCGVQDILRKMENFSSTRLGPVKAQKDNFAHIGLDVPQKDHGSVGITQKTFADLPCPIDTSPSLWKDRTRPLRDEELQICQSELGELCWLAAASRPDICARSARFSANLDSPKDIDVFRINDLVKTAKKWQGDCTLKYFAGLPKPARRSPSCPDEGGGELRPIHEGTTLLALKGFEKKGKWGIGEGILPCFRVAI